MKKGLFLTIAVVAISGCAHKKHTKAVSLPPAVTLPPPGGYPSGRGKAKIPAAEPGPGWTESGLASWYGHPYHGRPAANGEIYDMEKLTAAHRTLPFDTWVHVVNITNDKSVDVRITDRGPFIDGRVIDLSHAAARAIDLIGPGVAPVRIELIRVAQSAPPPAYAVQVGAFRDRGNAERVRSAMAARYGTARLVVRDGNPSLWRVLVGAEPTEAGATVLSDRIRRESGEKSAFVVRLDS
jgi:rare lipoprotein A